MYVVKVDGDTTDADYTGVSKRTTATGAEYKIVGVLAEILRRNETKNWIAGRDAAAEVAEAIKTAERYREWQYATACADIIAAIRALAPPETQP